MRIDQCGRRETTPTTQDDQHFVDKGELDREMRLILMRDIYQGMSMAIYSNRKRNSLGTQLLLNCCKRPPSKKSNSKVPYWARCIHQHDVHLSCTSYLRS